ncbi:TPA: hypothetical protein ACH3X1_006109 [Trebouxia sp. C0004]
MELFFGRCRHCSTSGYGRSAAALAAATTETVQKRGTTETNSKRSSTAAAEVGKLLKSSSAWINSNKPLKLYNTLDVEDSTVMSLVKKLLRSLPQSWDECIQLETEARAKGEPGNRKRKKLDLTSASAEAQQQQLQHCKSDTLSTSQREPGVPFCDSVCWRSDAPTTTGPGAVRARCFKLVMAYIESLRLKVAVSAVHEAEIFIDLADIAGVIQVVEQGKLRGGLSYVITRPFGSLLAIDDCAELVISVVQRAASIIQGLACLTSPVLHRDISVGNLIYYGDDQSTFLIDFGIAVVAPTGCFAAVGPQSITGASTVIARSVLEGEGYTLSSDLESLMYVLVFLAVNGAAHLGNKPFGPAALHVTFGEQESSENHVLRRCRSHLMQAVKSLRSVFWQPTYHRSSSARLCSQHDLAHLVTCMPAVLRDHEKIDNNFSHTTCMRVLWGQLLFLHTYICTPMLFIVSGFSACGLPRCHDRQQVFVAPLLLFIDCQNLYLTQ